MLLSSTLFALTFAAVRVAAEQGARGLIVDTAQGNVTGTLVSPTVRRFLGIPYAVANRWEAPQSPPVRTNTFNASDFGDSCPQSPPVGFSEILGPVGASSESEDCLNINVWTPSVQRTQNTAVMLWIYGGGFQFGTSETYIYDGQNLVQDHDDVLVVSFNYRTNLFGQPGALQLSTNATRTQNFGLLDIDAAVQWVYGNIAAFGGDPERIILFGESAGAVATDVYSYMHPSDTTVKGVIQQSGNVILPGVIAPLDPTSWNLVSDAVGCGTANDTAQLDCMKNLPYQTLKDAANGTPAYFFLVVDNITIFSDVDARATAGDFLQVPILAGSNRDEGDLFLVVQQEATLGFTMPVLTEILANIQGQLGFTCTTSKTVTDRVRAGVPAWRYLYDGVFPDMTFHPDLRAYHSAEISLIFGVFPNPNNSTNSTTPPPTADELALSKYMQSAWVAFARDPAQGLSNFGWPLYNTDMGSNATTLVKLGGFYNRTGASLAQGRLLDFTCGEQETLISVQEQLNGLLDRASMFVSS